MDRRAWLGFLLILGVAAGLRLYRIGDACYWLDEFDSLECSTGRGLAHVALPENRWVDSMPALTSLRGAPGWGKIWGSLDLDNHPPMYFILLRWWREGIGDNEEATRMMSAVFSIAAAGIFFAIVRDQAGTEPAMWAMAIMAIASSQIYFAQQTRGYAMWEALAMTGMWAVIRTEKGVRIGVWGLVLFLAALAMPLAHYFAAATDLSLFIIVMVYLRERRRKICAAWMVGAGIVYAVIWGRFAWRQRLAVVENNLWQLDATNHHMAMTLERFCVLPVRWLNEGWANGLSGTGGIVAAVAAAGIIAAILWALRRRKSAINWVIFMLPLVLGVAGLDVIRHARYLTVSRYTFVAGPGVFALLGLCAGGKWKWTGRTVCLAAIGISLAGLKGTYSENQDWRMVADVLREKVRPGDQIIYASGGRENWWAGAMYLGVSHYAPDLPGETMLLTDEHAAALWEASERGQTTWVISAEASERPARLFPAARVVDEVVLPDFGGVWELRR